jgi:hypothetical protein
MVRGALRVIAVAASMVTAGVWLASPQAQTQAAPSSAAVEEARKLLAVTKAGQMVEQMMASQMQIIIDVVSAANPGSEAAVRQTMEEVFLPEFRDTMPALINEMATLYTVHFTVDELRALNAFYTTPVGVKTISTMPVLMQQGMQMGQIWGQKVMEDALKKAEPKFRERGLKL